MKTTMAFDPQVLIGGTVGMVTLAGGIISVYVESSKKIALARQAVYFNEQRIEKLETRVKELETNIYQKLDKVMEHIQNIEILIAGSHSKD